MPKTPSDTMRMMNFKIKRKDGGQSYIYELSHGDLLLMLPGCQEEWVHAVPKSARSSGVRVNWTFRPYEAVKA
jgi:alkylated DNA repair dioxygenase AlkB